MIPSVEGKILNAIKPYDALRFAKQIKQGSIVTRTSDNKDSLMAMQSVTEVSKEIVVILDITERLVYLWWD